MTQALSNMDPAAPGVLLLEDDFIHGGLIKSALAATGVHVCMAVTVAEAADVLNVFLPDVIIADWDVYGIDGRAFVKALRARGEAQSRIPAILMTESPVDDAMRLDLLEDDFGWVLSKPFPMVSLPRLVRSVLKDRCNSKSQRIHSQAVRNTSI
jgi:DNA-binding response OmpR family regulator